MTRIALSSDWHLANYQGAQVRTLADGTNSRLRDILDCADWMVAQSLERGCTQFVHGGDVVHNRRYIHISAWHRIVAAFRGWGEHIPFHVLEGNHDMDQSGDGTSAVGALEPIVARAVTDAVVTKVGDVSVGWLPYTNDAEEVRRQVNRLLKAGARVLVAHLGIGDPAHSRCVPVDYEVPGRISIADLQPDRWQQVFMGHYHTAQDFAPLAPNVRYIGSPLQLSFGEAGVPKGFWTWDSESDELEWVENTVSPKFHVIRTRADVELGVGDRDHLWVRPATRGEAEELRDDLKDREVPVRVDMPPAVAAGTPRIDTKGGTLSERGLVEAYVSRMKPEAQDGERDALVAFGLQLLKEAE